MEELNKGQVVDMFTAGISMRKIAEHFGVTHKNISAILNDLGYTSDYRKRLPEEDICKEYQEDPDASATSLGNKYGVSNGTILRVLRKNSVPIKQKHRINIELDEELMVKMYVDEMKSANYIADHFDVNPQVIQKRLRKNGIQLRSGSEARQEYQVNEDFFKDIDSEEKAYWLGFMAADGFVCSNMRDFGITLSSKDRGHVEKFKNAIGYTGDVKDYSSVTSFGGVNFSKVVPASRKSCQHLISHGVVPKKTHITEAPIGVPEELNRHYIRGVVDGDGGIYVYDKSSSLEIVGDSGLLGWIRTQGPSSLTNLQKHKSIWRIRTYTANVAEWVEWLYKDATVYLDRKYERAMQVIKRGF